MLAAAGTGGRIRLWDTSDRAKTRALPAVAAHSGRIDSVLFAPTGRLLASSGADGAVRLWDLTNAARPTARARLTGSTVKLDPTVMTVQHRLAFDSTGKGLALPTGGGYNETPITYDVSGRVPKKVRAMTKYVVTSDRILHLELEGIDLAIRYCRAADATDGAVRLFGEEVVPVASPAVAARAFAGEAALLDEVLLEFDNRSRPWLRWADWLAALRLPDARPRATLHFNQYDQAVQAAIQGHGVALGRIALVRGMLADGRLVAHGGVPPAVSEYGYWLVGPGTDSAPEARLLADWILRQALSAASWGG